MRRAGAVIALAGFVACGELREAELGADAGPSDAGGSALDAARDTGSGPRDASSDPDARSPCPGRCLPERIQTTENLGPLVLDSFNAYFASANGGVWKMAKSGGAVRKLGDGKPSRLALAQDRLFWGEGDHLVACATGGCSGIPDGLVVDETGIDEVMSDGMRIVWHSHVGANDRIRSCPAATCGQGSVGTIVDVVSPHAGMGVGEGSVFWSDVSSFLWSCPIAPMPCTHPVKIGPASNDAFVLAGSVYWVNDQNVVTCPTTGCPGAPKTLGSSPSPHLIVADERDVYWREMAENKVLRCPLSGCAGDPEVIASDVNGIFFGGLALDAEYVYWTAKDGLWRRHK